MSCLVAGSDAGIGVDLGGTKIAAVLIDREGGCREQVVVSTRSERGPAAVLVDIAAAIRHLTALAGERGLRVRGVGVASAGIVDPQRGVLLTVTDSLPGFANHDLQADLAAEVELPVSVLNDVHAMAWGEQRLGAGRGVQDVLYVAVGTGIGGAFTHRGAVNVGAHGSAGDIGHVVVDRATTARRCPCGRPGHLEAYASGPAIAAAYAQVAGTAGGGGDLRPVVERARHGDRVARTVLEDAAVLLGRAVGGIASFLDPELVVFGGGLAGIPATLFWDRVTASLQDEVRSPLGPMVARSALGSTAAAIGAATTTLWPAFGATSSGLGGCE